MTNILEKLKMERDHLADFLARSASDDDGEQVAITDHDAQVVNNAVDELAWYDAQIAAIEADHVTGKSVAELRELRNRLVADAVAVVHRPDFALPVSDDWSAAFELYNDIHRRINIVDAAIYRQGGAV